ncbi:MAG: hypothetical protein IIZ74_09370, partial [Erysipelotrichaceae bacterium]|nr:hypothetical protein [Erysipelotrichaceae bacterium]
MIIILALGLFIYKTGYEKHVISTSVQDKYELIIYQVGEPDFPFGATYCSLTLNEDGRRTDEMEIAIHNDGKAIDEDNFEVVWMDKGVSVTTHGEEQD